MEQKDIENDDLVSLRGMISNIANNFKGYSDFLDCLSLKEFADVYSKIGVRLEEDEKGNVLKLDLNSISDNRISDIIIDATEDKPYLYFKYCFRKPFYGFLKMVIFMLIGALIWKFGNW